MNETKLIIKTKLKIQIYVQNYIHRKEKKVFSPPQSQCLFLQLVIFKSQTCKKMVQQKTEKRHNVEKSLKTKNKLKN